MDQGNIKTESSNYLRSKRGTCMACDQRSQCKRPIKDTEDEDTSLHACEKYIGGK